MKNLSWPLGITAVMLLFIGMTLAFVRKAFSERVDLVSADYYYRDKEYSLRLDKEKNLLRLGLTEIKRTTDGITIILPQYFLGKPISGKVSFYSPLNPAEDFIQNVRTTGPEVRLVAQLKGDHIWKVSFDFETTGERFFTEKNIGLSSEMNR